MTTARRLRIAPVFLALLALLPACSLGQPSGATKQGRDIHHLYLIVFIIAAVVFVFVDGLIVFMVIRYRRKPGDDELPPQIHGNTIAEVVWTIIPALIIFGLFGVSVLTLRRVDAKAADTSTVNIEVVGFQWQWQFNYTDDQVSVKGTITKPPQLVIPVNEDIHIVEHSNDVIHSFYVQDFNFKRDVVPGHTNEFYFRAERPGVFGGQCAEFCGLLHNKMEFSVKVVERPEYQAFLQSLKDQAAKLLESCGQPATDVKISAQAIAFDKQCISVPVNQAFKIDFDNKDAGVPHNVAVYEDDSARKPFTQGEVFSGAGSRTYDGAPIPTAGQYFFRCDVHPGQMNGIVVVK